MSAAESSPSRPRPILLVALAVVAAIAVWRFLPSFTGGAGFTRTTATALRLQTVDVAELATYTVGETHTAGRPKRDPWSFGTPPLPEPSAAPPPSRAPEPESAAPEPPVPTPPRQAPPPRPVGPPLPQVDVIYLGSFGHRGNPIAVFKDTLEDGPKIYNALAGDRIKDKFEVHNIGYESVDLRFVDFPDEPPVRLPIGGGR